MAFGSLRDFATMLEDRGALVRIRAEVSPELEITEIADRVCKGPAAANKALLFENVKGQSIPVLINMFGSAERMAWALGVDDLDQLGAKLTALIDLRLPDGLNEVVGRGSALLRALRDSGLKPRRAHRAPVQAIVESRNPTLDDIPILKCWPNDGGRFITLPQVITHDLSRGTQNVGMYRLQRLDDRTLLMHWQRHKGGAEHERVARETKRPQIPAAIVLGGDPAAIWSASAPLPPDIDEYWLAGWLRGRAIPFVDCITQPLQVPANADIVIEGYVDPNEHFPEGPFGDHTGYYTPVGPFPAFHVTAITQREDPIYPATVVGIPPMEDYWMGKATERLFLPLVKLFLPEVMDFAMPAPGLFHNLVVVSIKKRFPGHARKVIHGLWGLALLSLAKAIVVVDEWVDVHDAMVTGWQALGNVDWSRDVIVSDGPVDQLDHAAPLEAFGGKIGIDATAKLPEEGHPRPWPEVVRMDPAVKVRIDALWSELGLP